MSILDRLLPYKPPTWIATSYTNVHYKSYTLDTSSIEYLEVTMELLNKYSGKIESIKRIQHPYAYFRYLIRRQQIMDSSSNYNIPETRKLIFIANESSVDDIINCNGDLRRYNNFSGHFSYSADHILIMKGMHGYSSTSRDSNSYPEYIIKIKFV